MALTVKNQPATVVSTGAAAFDGTPIITEAVTSNQSTGAVEQVHAGTTTVGYLDPLVLDATGATVETKPVEAPAPTTPKSKPKPVTTKPVTK